MHPSSCRCGDRSLVGIGTGVPRDDKPWRAAGSRRSDRGEETDHEAPRRARGGHAAACDGLRGGPARRAAGRVGSGADRDQDRTVPPALRGRCARPGAHQLRTARLDPPARRRTAARRRRHRATGGPRSRPGPQPHGPAARRRGRSARGGRRGQRHGGIRAGELERHPRAGPHARRGGGRGGRRVGHPRARLRLHVVRRSVGG